MARILGIDLPKNKRIERALTAIYGIGISKSRKILKIAKIDPDKKTNDLTESELTVLRQAIEKENVEGNLRREIRLNIKRLMEIGCYRGKRHRKKLPVRGQRTRTNARTRKGPKKTVANKKKIASKK